MSVNVFSSTTHESRNKPAPVTGNKVGPYRIALDAPILIGALQIATDSTEAGSTDSVIVATAHLARTGDMLLFTSGAVSGDFSTVHETATNSITLAQKLTSTLGAGITFTIYRPRPVAVDASGGLPVSGTVTVEPSYAEDDPITEGFLVGGTDITGTTFKAFKTTKISSDAIDITLDYFTVANATLGLDEGSGGLDRIRSLRDQDNNTAGSRGNLSVMSKTLVFDGSNWDRARGDTTNGLDVDVTRVSGTVSVSGAAKTTAAPTAVSVGVASTAVLGSATYKEIIFTNTSANTISLAFGNTAVLNSGVTLIGGGSSFVLDGVFTGTVNAIASVAASNLAVQAFT